MAKNKEIDPLWVIIIFSLISLFVAYITFGILQSTGVVKDERIQLGGAAAGFYAVFILFHLLYSSQMEKKTTRETEDSIFQINFVFPDGYDANFMQESVNGKYTILEHGKQIGSGDVSLQPEYDWVWRPQIKIKPDYLIALELEDDNHRKWKTKIIPIITTKPIEMPKK